MKFKHLVPLCDPWCTPASFWWCIPCTGIYAQTVLTIGGCAPYQNWHHCGGALSILSRTGEVKLRVPDIRRELLTVADICRPGHARRRHIGSCEGFKAVSGQVFKILATYDGLCNCTRYTSTTSCAVSQTRSISGNTSNSRSSTSLITSTRASQSEEACTHETQPHHRTSFLTRQRCWQGSAASAGSRQGWKRQASNLYLSKDWSLPRASSAYPADPVLVGRYPTQIYLPWKGDILSTSVWFDNGRREGIRYPMRVRETAVCESNVSIFLLID